MSSKVVIESETTLESREYIKNFLNDHYSGVLATADNAANPHASVVYYKLEDDFSLIFSTKTETQKYKNIEENEQVAFLVYDEKVQTVVQIFGEVEKVEDEDRANAAHDTMYQASAETAQSELPPAEKLSAGNFVALRLMPQTIKLAVYARPESDGDDLFETLLFSVRK